MKIITSAPANFKIGAALIKIYQHTEFSHVAIIKDKLVYQASHGFVNCTHIDNFLADNVIYDSFEVEESLVDMDFVYRQLGKKYSYLQILEIAIEYFTKIKIRIKNDRFICSEFVGKALRLPWVDDHTSPKEIAEYLHSMEKK